jgi:hypothetical protein
VAVGVALAFAALAFAAPASAKTARARTDVVTAGPARFEVLTPTLIRMEYAQDRRFQDAPTMTATRSPLPLPRFTKRRRHGWLTIRTRRVTLSYRLGSGAFTQASVRLHLRLGRRKLTVHPVAGSAAGNLGGWTRALDNQDAPVPLHPGAISTAGWYVLDDTNTALLTSSSPGFAVRPAHTGAYQDWYLFVYGHDYSRGLTDLRALSGPAPLLPRSAFGVWFSRYYPYSESDYHALLAQFRSNHVPLDTVSIDTDFKRENSAVGAVAAASLAGAPGRPYSWNGWEWNTQLFPDPQRFIDWAHGQGLSLAINIHPSIDSTDPRYPATVAQGGPLTADSGCRLLQADPLGACMTFDWHDARQLAAYFALHAPFAQQGIDLFWLDWCCDGPQQSVPGLTDDTWINSRYSAEQRARGSRWPAFSRIGGGFAESGAGADGPDNDRAAEGVGAFAEHRYTIQFTGDTCATWPMLAFEAQLSASEGNIGLPYVSHDIGGYNGASSSLPCGEQDIAVVPGATATHHLPDDLYARWVQFGTFQPLDRLHSNHGDRLPWEYGPAADRSATSFLQLREELNPYIYTLARHAYDTGLPLTGGLYLRWPGRSDAYRYPNEYTFGPDMVVEPVTAPGDPAPATIWVPPGTWTDYFTGQRFTGPRAVTLSVPLSQMPVLVRAGAIIPTQPYAPYTPAGPPGAVTVSEFPGGNGHFALYDDQGRGFGYQHGLDTWTPISQRRRGRRFSVTIGAARGRFPGALRARTWQLRVIGVRRPRSVRVNGHRRRWSYDAGARTVTMSTGAVPTNRPVVVTGR